MKYPLVRMSPSGLWQLEEDYQIGGYIIPAGFMTDFGTIPLLATVFLGRATQRDFQRATLLHDYMLKQGLEDSAHLVFKRLLIDDGVLWWKIWLMYKAVKYIRPVLRWFK